jgi:arylsulfatase A-like enzyme
MNKRTNYQIQLLAGVALASAMFESCAPKSSDIQNPNVIFVLVDDLGFGDLSMYGQTEFKTPHIDQFAKEGMVFNNFYTGAPVCGPSRASLLTGMHTGNTSVRGNSPAQLIGDDEYTIAKAFKDAGYVTANIGKWGIGHPPPVDDPARKGFDYFYGYVNMWHAHNFYPEFLYRNGEKVILNNKTQLIDGKNPWEKYPEGTGVAEVRNDYTPYLFEDDVDLFLEKNKDNKFFLYYAMNVPHTNNEAIPDGMEVPDWGEFADKDWPDPEKGFAAMMQNLDNSMGRMMAKLKELGIDDNTVVFFCSDNGPHQEGGHTVAYFNSNGEYRGRKRDLYEGGIKTPFFVRWPAAIKPGSSSDHIGAFWDMLPTFADLAGNTKTIECDGISIYPTLIGKPEQQKQHEYLYWEFYESGGLQAIRSNNWKYIKLNVRNGQPVQKELYDLSVDAGETNNIYDKHPELIEKFEAYMKDGHSPFALTTLFYDDGANIQFPFKLD